MAGVGGVQPPIIANVSNVQAVQPVLQPGSVFNATVQNQNGQLVLVGANARIPVEQAALFAGQTVSVEVLQTEPQLQIRITPQQPQPTAAQPQPTAAQPQPTAPHQGFSLLSTPGGEASAETVAGGPLARVLAGVLENLGALDRAQAAVQLTATNVPLTESATRALLNLFLARSTLGTDLGAVQNFLEQAAAAGAFPRAQAAEISTLISRLLLTDESQLRAVVEQLVQRAGQSYEAQLAKGLANGDVEAFLRSASDDLRLALGRMRNNEGLTNFFRAQGQLGLFHESVDSAVERLLAGLLQNLRGLDQAYLFMELPIDPRSPFRHGQVHFFGDQRNGRKRFDPKNVTAIIDLSLTRLGDVWVGLNVFQGQCSCTFRVAEEAAATAIRENSGELITALSEAGYSSASVHIAPWHGDRVRETAALMRQFSGLNVQA